MPESEDEQTQSFDMKCKQMINTIEHSPRA